MNSYDSVMLFVFLPVFYEPVVASLANPVLLSPPSFCSAPPAYGEEVWHIVHVSHVSAEAYDGWLGLSIRDSAVSF
jgi:hypothetical protein